MATFTERLNQAIKIRNISQAELCERTGIPKSAMSQYCSGAFIPKQKRTYLLAKALNINEAWLMGYDDVAMDRKKDNFERASDYYNASAVLAKKFAPGTTESDVSDVEMIAVKATEKQWTYILNKLSQENRDRLQEQAELLLLKQQVQADKEEK